MSSTNRGAVRVTNDAYYTPDALARACVATIADAVCGRRVWEPHVGGGAFARALREAGAIVSVSDVDPGARGLADGCVVGFAVVADFLRERPIPPQAWIVGNPPFADAEAHVRHALACAEVGVAFLLRLAFLETRGRAPFWREHPPAEVHVLASRPSFTANGQTDSAAYGWFVWRKRHTGPPTLHWLAWKAGR